MKKAVAAILTHQDQVLFIRRHDYLRAFPGYWSVPGGKVDKGESFEQALVREIQEEIGIEIGPEQYRYIGTITTPFFHRYRFETQCFRVELQNKNLKLEDPHPEFNQWCWQRPQQFIQDYDQGERLMVPPFVTLFREMAQDFAQARMRELDHKKLESGIAAIGVLGGLTQVLIPSPTLPPATNTNAFYYGDSEKILVDPSPKDEQTLEYLFEWMDQNPVHTIFLTHHHGDHLKNVDQILARFPRIDIALSQFTLDRIHQIRGEQFLQHAASITIKKEGDTLSSWNQQAVKVFEIPGHDNGQLALAPENLAWFIAGDLFQGVGSVVIDPEFGDMDLYLETLERVIAIKPRVLFPSHGMGRGGVHILEKVRDHRLEREQEILALLKEHKNIDEIVATIYHDIPKELIPYAKANVNCHLKRIQKRYTL